MIEPQTPPPLDLGASLRVGDIAEAANRLARALETGRRVRLDASALREVDVAGLQLIAAAALAAEAQGRELAVEAPRDGALRRAAARCGLAPEALSLSAGEPPVPARETEAT